MPVTTTIQGVLHTALGLGPAVAKLRISNPSFTASDGSAVMADTAIVPIASDGSYSIPLAANEGSTPVSVYTITYLTARSQYTEQWSVPLTGQGVTLTIAQVRINPVVPVPPFAIPVSQLYSATANIGDVLLFNGATYTPGTIQSIYPFTFTSETTFTITGTAHGQGTALLVRLFDTQGNLSDASVQVNPMTGDVTVWTQNPISGSGFIYGGLSRSLPNFSKVFLNQSAVLIRQAEHRFNTPNLDIAIYDEDGYLLDAATHVRITSGYDIQITFQYPLTFRVVILGCLGTTPATVVGGGTPVSIAPYTATVANEADWTIAASAHGKGPYAVPFCFTNDNPAIAVSFSYSREADGSLNLSFDVPFTGLIQVI